MKPASLFVPHGAPTFALRPGAAGAALRAYAEQLPRPRAVVMVSAHWQTLQPTVGTARRLETIHDFWGFPEALYDIRYPASGCPEGAKAVMAALETAGYEVAEDNSRGLDHGAWVPLRLMYPDADVAVIPVSLPARGGPEAAYRLGLALAPLAEQGFLVLGSGSVTHNLMDYQRAWQLGGGTPPYVRGFADWLAQHMAAQDLPKVLHYRQQGPGGAQAHPSEEHLLPLFVAWGAAGPQAQSERFFAGIDDFVIAMDAFAFFDQPGAVQ